MNVFLACFLGCLFANICMFLGFRVIARWSMRRIAAAGGGTRAESAASDLHRQSAMKAQLEMDRLIEEHRAQLIELEREYVEGLPEESKEAVMKLAWMRGCLSLLSGKTTHHEHEHCPMCGRSWDDDLDRESSPPPRRASGPESASESASESEPPVAAASAR